MKIGRDKKLYINIEVGGESGETQLTDTSRNN